MNKEKNTVEKYSGYYKYLKYKYPDIDQQIDVLIENEGPLALVTFEVIFEYSTSSEALKLPQSLYHRAGDSTGIIFPYEDSGKFYSGFLNSKQILNSFHILISYYGFLALASEYGGNLSSFKLTSRKTTT